MLIQIAYPVALHYQTAADKAKVPLATFLQRQLVKFADIPLGQRALILTVDALQQVDTLLGVGSTKDAPALLAAIRAFAGISIGGVAVDFSPAQLDEIAHRAEKQGKTPQAVVEDIVEQMRWRFFEDAVVAR